MIYQLIHKLRHRVDDLSNIFNCWLNFVDTKPPPAYTVIIGQKEPIQLLFSWMKEQSDQGVSLPI